MSLLINWIVSLHFLRGQIKNCPPLLVIHHFQSIIEVYQGNWPLALLALHSSSLVAVSNLDHHAGCPSQHQHCHSTKISVVSSFWDKTYLPLVWYLVHSWWCHPCYLVPLAHHIMFVWPVVGLSLGIGLDPLYHMWFLSFASSASLTCCSQLVDLAAVVCTLPDIFCDWPIHLPIALGWIVTSSAFFFGWDLWACSLCIFFSISKLKLCAPWVPR